MIKLNQSKVVDSLGLNSKKSIIYANAARNTTPVLKNV